MSERNFKRRDYEVIDCGNPKHCSESHEKEMLKRVQHDNKLSVQDGITPCIVMTNKVAFTMAEVLVTVAIMGVIAVMTVPSIVNKQTLKANRVKLQKAVAVYDHFINEAINIEGIQRNVDALDEWGSKNSCENSRKYFKINQYYKDSKGKVNMCKFRTTDGMWWDLTKPSKTIVSFKKADLTPPKADAHSGYKEDSVTTFYFVTRFDGNLAVRTIDMYYGTQTGDASMFVNSANVRAYIEGKKITEIIPYCTGKPYKSCITKGSTSGVYDENGKLIFNRQYCDSNGLNCYNGRKVLYQTFGNNGSAIAWEYNQQGDGPAGAVYETYKDDPVSGQTYMNEQWYGSGCSHNTTFDHEGCTTHVTYEPTYEKVDGKWKKVSETKVSCNLNTVTNEYTKSCKTTVTNY